MKKKILVTGAAGFIGANFIKSCDDLDLEVLGCDFWENFQHRSPYNPLLKKEFRKISVDEIFSQPAILEKESIESIVHLGAITDTTVQDKDLLNRYNLECSQVLWTFATEHQIPFIYASSAATYGRGELGYSDDPELLFKLQPLNYYGQSKHLFDCWALGQSKTPPSWCGFKFFNVYGLGEYHKGFMASVPFKAFLEIHETHQLRLFKSHQANIADGEQKRDFIAVDDVVKALHFGLKKPALQGVYNLGTGRARSFNELAQVLFQSMHKPVKIEFIETPMSVRNSYQYYTQADLKRLRAIGFDHEFQSIETGVKDYVQELMLEHSEPFSKCFS